MKIFNIFGSSQRYFNLGTKMAISRETKENQVKQLTQRLADSALVVITDYKGLSVQAVQQLRSELGQQGSAFQVAKNTLIQRALAQVPALKDADAGLFSGPTGLAFGFEDEVTVAQVLAKFAKTNPALEMRAAINARGEVLDAVEVARLAALPSRNQLEAQLVGTIAAPVSGFVNVLAGNLRGLIQVLKGLSEQPANS